MYLTGDPPEFRVQERHQVIERVLHPLLETSRALTSSGPIAMRCAPLTTGCFFLLRRNHPRPQRLPWTRLATHRLGGHPDSLKSRKRRLECDRESQLQRVAGWLHAGALRCNRTLNVADTIGAG